MGSEPIVSNKAGTHAAVVAGGALVASLVAAGVSAMMGGAFAWPAVLIAISAVPALLPSLLGGQTVPSRYGALVLGGLSGQMLLTLGGALVVRVAADIAAKPFLGGVAAGAGLLMCAQVALAVWTLNRAMPAVEGSALAGNGVREDDTDA